MRTLGRASWVGALGLCALLAACARSRSPASAGEPTPEPTTPRETRPSVPAAGSASAAGAGGVSGAAGSFVADNPQANAGRLAVNPNGCSQPARQCPESCNALRIVGGRVRRRVGCAAHDDCVFKLTILSPIVLDVGTCDRVLLDLIVEDGDGRTRRHFGSLATPAWDELLAIARKLADTVVPAELAGDCPSCRAVDSVELVLGGEVLRYPSAQPLPELSELDSLLQRMTDQLLACGGELLEDDSCEVEQQPGIGTDNACEIVYTGADSASTVCRLPPDVDAPCRDALECLCTGTVLGRTPQTSVEDCMDSWLMPRGAPTLNDFCTQGPAGARSLSAALRQFGASQRATVTSSALCDSLGGWY